MKKIIHTIFWGEKYTIKYNVINLAESSNLLGFHRMQFIRQKVKKKSGKNM